jgi:tripartite-type tricarboxylate transporter receptor subunit TctC
MLTRRLFMLALAAPTLGVTGGASAGAAYPSQTIKIVVPFPPGTPSEFAIRLIADRLSARFGQAVVVEHRPGGAGGTVGAASVATAEPDGYTLLASPPGPLVTAAAIYKNLGYDPSTGLAPVALLFNSPLLLAVSPGVQATTVHELVASARSLPGKLSFASPGLGTQPHLLGEMLKARAVVDIVHVPYKGSAAAVADLLAGHVQICFEAATLLLPQAAAGKLKLIAIAGESRMAQVPAVPTMVESGFAGLTGGFWSGIVAPSGIPADVVARLNAAINEIMRSQEVEVALVRLGAEAKLGSPLEFANFIDAERRKWSAVIAAAGIKVD